MAAGGRSSPTEKNKSRFLVSFPGFLKQFMPDVFSICQHRSDEFCLLVLCGLLLGRKGLILVGQW
jgi:hypothetical protein